jgi:hypothetical protein
MLLGDVIAGFQDPVLAGEALLALDDLVLTARIAAAAAEEDITPGEFAMQAVGHFVNRADDEEWLTLVGLMSRADNPGQVFLRRILASGLAARAAA